MRFTNTCITGFKSDGNVYLEAFEKQFISQLTSESEKNYESKNSERTKLKGNADKFNVH